jgi:hypothetical protein
MELQERRQARIPAWLAAGPLVFVYEHSREAGARAPGVTEVTIVREKAGTGREAVAKPAAIRGIDKARSIKRPCTWEQ